MNGMSVAYKPLSASNTVKSTGGEFFGVICNSTSAGVVTFYDHPSTASGNVLFGPITLVAGQTYLFNGLGVRAAQGIYMKLVSGAAQVNALYL